MTRRILALLAISALVAALAASPVAQGAKPRKGGLYTGELVRQNAVSKKIRMRVSSDGKTAKARLFCNGPAFGSTRSFAISKSGRFTGVNKAGTLLVWRIRGRFVTRDRVEAKLYLPATCDGKGGSITLDLKT
jgi:hypothetical protein